MNGEHLHAFDLQLCDYMVDNVVQHMNRPTFRADLEAILTSRPLRDYLKQVQDDSSDASDMRLLLNDNELYRLQLTCEDDALVRSWTSSETLRRRYIETLPEVRDHLSRQAAEDWSEACATFARQREDRYTRLSDGIAVVREWVGRLRTLLRVMGAVNLLPAPEGGFPTPTCPKPPSVSYSPAMTLPRQDERADGSLRAALAEIQESQREVRDLLVSQRTVQDWYSVEEFAGRVGKSEFTCREWCRLSRIRATKKGSGRGKHLSWSISNEEMLRYQREGLLPQVRPSTK